MDLADYQSEHPETMAPKVEAVNNIDAALNIIADTSDYEVEDDLMEGLALLDRCLYFMANLDIMDIKMPDSLDVQSAVLYRDIKDFINQWTHLEDR